MIAQDYEDRLDKLFALLGNMYDHLNREHPAIIATFPFPLLAQVLHTLGDIDTETLRAMDDSVGNIFCSTLEETHMPACNNVPCNVCGAIETYRYWQSLR